MIPRHLLIIQLVGLLLISGCGYHNPNVGPAAGSTPPKTLHLAVWDNRTNELGLESTLQQTLNRWFKRSAAVKLTWDETNADLVLDGEIQSINLPGLSYGLYDQAQETQATLTVSYTLRSGSDQKTILAESGLVFSETFIIENNAAVTRGNKQKALTTLTEDLAERIYHYTLEAARLAAVSAR